MGRWWSSWALLLCGRNEGILLTGAAALRKLYFWLLNRGLPVLHLSFPSEVLDKEELLGALRDSLFVIFDVEELRAHPDKVVDAISLAKEEEALETCASASQLLLRLLRDQGREEGWGLLVHDMAFQVLYAQAKKDALKRVERERGALCSPKNVSEMREDLNVSFSGPVFEPSSLDAA